MANPDPVKLRWFPYDHATMGPPAGLRDFQVGWYFNLFWGTVHSSVRPGYLTVTRSNLWIYAGAHSRAHWDANRALVMAAFVIERYQNSLLLHHPIAASVVEEQLKKIQQKKRGWISEVSTGFLKPVGDSSSPLPSDFSVDPVEPTQIQRQSTTRARAPARASPRDIAQRVAALLGMPQTTSNLRAVEAGLTAEAAYSDMEIEKTARAIVSYARESEAAIDRFWFEDTKWRNVGNERQSKPSASAARSERNRRAILDGLAKSISRREDTSGRDEPDRDECESAAG